MTMIHVKATLCVLLVLLPACTDLSQATDPLWAEAELQDAARPSIAASRTHDFERALVLAADLKH